MLTKEDADTVHGINERLSFENAARIVGFMIELIERMANLEIDSIEDYEDEIEEDIDEEELDEEERAIRELEAPLPTRPMRKAVVEEETAGSDEL